MAASGAYSRAARCTRKQRGQQNQLDNSNVCSFVMRTVAAEEPQGATEQSSLCTKKLQSMIPGRYGSAERTEDGEALGAARTESARWR